MLIKTTTHFLRPFECFLLLLLGIVHTIESARILAYFPTPSKSHHYFFVPILFELGRRGHHVDYYSPFQPKLSHPNVTYVEVENMMPTFYKRRKEYWFMKYLSESEKLFLGVHRIGVEVARQLSTTPAVKNLLKSKDKYDLLIHQGLLIMEHSYVFAHKFNVTSVALLSVSDIFNANEFAGLVNNPAYMVNTIREVVTTDRMGFFDRVYNTLSNTIFYPMVYYNYLSTMQRTIDECFTYPGWESRPTLKELMSNEALLLANGHHAVGYAYPKAPHYKDVGGAVMQPIKPLPEDLETYINQSTEGVIYFSLGTIVHLDNIDSNLKHTFARVFATRKERVLWKWSGEPLPNVSDNVKLSNYFPQQDVLAHKNVKLFITHSGLQSSFEAVHLGVPLIIIPCYGDQLKNALAMEQAGYGVMLKPSVITHDSLSWAIEEVLTNQRYKESVLKGSALLRDRPMSPVDEAVYWIEYVLRHGNVLQPAGAKLSYIELHCLDVYFVILIAVIGLWYSIKTLLRLLRSFLTRSLSSFKRKED